METTGYISTLSTVQLPSTNQVTNYTTLVQTTQSTTISTTPLQTTDLSTTTLQTTEMTTDATTSYIDTTKMATNTTSVQTTQSTTISTTPLQTTNLSTTTLQTTEMTTDATTTHIDTTEMATNTAPVQTTQSTTISTTPLQTTNLSTTTLQTTEMTTDATTTHIDTTKMATNTTPVQTTQSTTISTTPLQTTDLSTTTLQTTEMTTDATTTYIHTTKMATNTTPVQTTQSTTISTTPLQTTDLSTTTLQTTEMTTDATTTYIHTTEMATNTTPVQTTQSTTISTTPLQTTDLSTTTLQTTEMTTDATTTYIHTTEMATNTTPVQTTQSTTISTTPLQTTDLSTTTLKTTEMTTDATTSYIDTTKMTTGTTLVQTTLSTATTSIPLQTTNISSTTESTTTITTPEMTTQHTTTFPRPSTSPTTMKPVITWKRSNLLLRISRPWSPKLLINSSTEYSTLQRDIKNNVNSSLNGKVSEVAILEFRPGSIIAELSFNSSENNALDILKAQVQKGKIGNLQVDSSFPLQISSSVIVYANTTKFVKVEGNSFSANCLSNATNVKMMWMLKGLPILEGNNVNARIQVTQRITSKNETVGTLIFKYLRLRDSGELQCLAAGTVSSNTVVLYLDVKPLPEVMITTDTPFVEIGRSVTLNCSISNKVNASITFRIIKGRRGVNKTTNFNNKATISLVNVQEETTVLCLATNPSGNASANTTVRVYTPQKKTCPEDKKWSITPADKTVEIPCVAGFVGKIQRYCKNDGTWDAPNNQFCVKQEFEKIKEALKDIEDNIGEDTSVVLEKLANLTDEKNQNNLTAGDMIVSIDALDKVVGITNQQKEIGESQINGFFTVASDIITPTRGNQWSAIKKKDEKLGFKLLKKMEDFGSLAADKASNITKTTISKPNLAVVVSKVATKEKTSFPGNTSKLDEWVIKAKTNMDLSSSLLKEIAPAGQDSMPVSVVLFRNLSSILPDSNEEQSSNGTKPVQKLNTMVLSVNVGNKEKTVLKNPIKLGFQYLNMGQNLKALCSYWDFNKPGTASGGWSQDGCQVATSNNSRAQCQCYHLTNFAVLTSIAPEDSEALSMITYIGCGISIGCCLLTMILYIIFWKQMTRSELGKSKSVLLINMCVAVILAYTLFLAGIKTATVDKVACTVVAAFLHFFCLSLFFALLIYAIDMAVTIHSVFTPTFNRLPLMLVLSWLCPAIIVAISLGVTQTEGYGNDKYCWLSVENEVIYAFIGPIVLVIAINTILLIYLFRTSMSSTSLKNKSERERIKSGALALCLTTPVFGITWIIGIFAINEDTIILQYLFTIINSLQGLIIFLAFCVFCKQFRQAVTQRYERLSDLRSTARTFQTRTKQSQEQSRNSKYDNAAYDEFDDSLPDYLNLEYMCNDDAAVDVSYEFESLPVQPQPRTRRYLDDSVKFPSTEQYPGPKYSKHQSSWDNEDKRKRPTDKRQPEPRNTRVSFNKALHFPGEFRLAHKTANFF